MSQPVTAIDLLCYPPTRRDNAAASGTLQCLEPPQALVQRMDAAGVEKAFITQCKKWSCERQWLCMDTRLEDVLRYTQACPERFVGLAGYNPYDIPGSLEEIDGAARRHGFRGVYVNAASFRMPLTGPQMYPLFAKALELGLPVVVQLRNAGSLDERFTLLELERVAADFETLVLLGALAEWPEQRETEPVWARQDNVHFVLDSSALFAAPPWAREFLDSAEGRDRFCWGSHEADWKVALAQVWALGLAEEIEHSLLRDNARRLFRLEGEFPVRAEQPPAREPLIAER